MKQAERDRKRALWEERVAAYEASGQSGRDWCHEQGIPEHQLWYWLPKIRAKKQRPAEAATSRWVSVAPEKEPTGSGVTLRVGSIVLEIQQGFDQQVLADVLRSLMNVC